MVNIRRVLLEHRHHAQVVPGAGYIAVGVLFDLRVKVFFVVVAVNRDGFLYRLDFAAQVLRRAIVLLFLAVSVIGPHFNRVGSAIRRCHRELIIVGQVADSAIVRRACGRITVGRLPLYRKAV